MQSTPKRQAFRSSGWRLWVQLEAASLQVSVKFRDCSGEGTEPWIGSGTGNCQLQEYLLL